MTIHFPLLKQEEKWELESSNCHAPLLLSNALVNYISLEAPPCLGGFSTVIQRYMQMLQVKS